MSCGFVTTRMKHLRQANFIQERAELRFLVLEVHGPRSEVCVLGVGVVSSALGMASCWQSREVAQDITWHEIGNVLVCPCPCGLLVRLQDPIRRPHFTTQSPPPAFRLPRGTQSPAPPNPCIQGEKLSNHSSGQRAGLAPRNPPPASAWEGPSPSHQHSYRQRGRASSRGVPGQRGHQRTLSHHTESLPASQNRAVDVETPRHLCVLGPAAAVCDLTQIRQSRAGVLCKFIF